MYCLINYCLSLCYILYEWNERGHFVITELKEDDSLPRDNESHSQIKKRKFSATHVASNPVHFEKESDAFEIRFYDVFRFVGDRLVCGG